MGNVIKVCFTEHHYQDPGQSTKRCNYPLLAVTKEELVTIYLGGFVTPAANGLIKGDDIYYEIRGVWVRINTKVNSRGGHHKGSCLLDTKLA